MAKNVCIASNNCSRNKEVEAYLSLLGYSVTEVIGKCTIVIKPIKSNVMFGLTGIIDIETLEWIVKPDTLANKLYNDIDKQLKKVGLICLSSFERHSSPKDAGEILRYITLVNYNTGKVIVNHKQRKEILICGKYIVLIKEICNKAKFRCSFVDLESMKFLDTRVNTFDLGWTHGIPILQDLSKQACLGITMGYFKIPIYPAENLEFKIPKDWRESYVYATDYGIESEIDVLKRELEDPFLIKIQRVEEYNGKEIPEDEAYFWVAKPGTNQKADKKVNYIYYDRHGEVVGRRFRVMDSSETTISNTLSKIVDAIENGTLKADDNGVYEYRIRIKQKQH